MITDNTNLVLDIFTLNTDAFIFKKVSQSNLTSTFNSLVYLSINDFLILEQLIDLTGADCEWLVRRHELLRVDVDPLVAACWPLELRRFHVEARVDATLSLWLQDEVAAGFTGVHVVDEVGWLLPETCLLA
jgi:hypothetical protein